MKAIFAVTNATWAVVKNKAWKKFQACTGFETHDLCDAGVGGQATLLVASCCRNYYLARGSNEPVDSKMSTLVNGP